nr:cysteine-rich KTR domain-containing protein [Blautia producta]
MCPFCKSKTRLKIYEDTVLKNFPLFCPKCRREAIIDVKHFCIAIIRELDAKTQSR